MGFIAAAQPGLLLAEETELSNLVRCFLLSHCLARQRHVHRSPEQSSLPKSPRNGHPLLSLPMSQRGRSSCPLWNSIGLLLWQEGHQQVQAWRYGLSSDSDAAFAARMQQLHAYKACVGDTHVGFRSADDAGLSRWAHAQRSSAAEGCLPADRCVICIWVQVAEQHSCLRLPNVSSSAALVECVGDVHIRLTAMQVCDSEASRI